LTKFAVREPNSRREMAQLLWGAKGAMDSLLLLRSLIVVLALLAALAWGRYFDQVSAGLRRFFFEPSSPVNLGLTRVVVFALVLDSAWNSEAPWFAGLPPEFRRFPPGWEWAAQVLPMTPGGVGLARFVLIGAAGLALFGLCSRVTSAVAAVLAFYVFGVENCFFKISHGNHVPTLSALVLAVSPCGDGLSLDAWLRRRRGLSAFSMHAAYTVPVRFCWLLLGTMYLFPGLWKLWQTGDLWLVGDKPLADMYEKWGQMRDYVPLVRVDDLPFLLAIAGISTLIFEIGFFPALFFRTSRVIAGVFGALFHLGVGLSMGIWFNPIHPLIVLFDYPGILELKPLSRLRSRWIQSTGTPPTAAAPSLRTARAAHAAFVLGSVFCFGQVLAGLAPIDSWPIAIYPRFATRNKPPRTSSALRFVVQSGQGSQREVRPRFVHFGNDSASVTRIISSLLDGKRKNKAEKFEGYSKLLLRIAEEELGAFKPGDTFLIYRYTFPTDPALRQGNDSEDELIAELQL